MEKVRNILAKLDASTDSKKEELIAESLIRGIFMHKLERETLLNTLSLSKDDVQILQGFSVKISKIAEDLKERNIKTRDHNLCINSHTTECSLDKKGPKIRRSYTLNYRENCAEISNSEGLCKRERSRRFSGIREHRATC